MSVDENTSDGFHTFKELYEHRHALFIALCACGISWKSRLHHDGSNFDGWFVAGLSTGFGDVTYHLPDRLWGSHPGDVIEKAPEWDRHTPEQAIERLLKIAAPLEATK